MILREEWYGQLLKIKEHLHIQPFNSILDLNLEILLSVQLYYRAICTGGALMNVLGTYGLIFASKTNLEIHKMDSKSKSRVQMVSKLKFFAFPEKQEWVLQIFSFSFLQSRCKCAGCGFRFFTRFSVRVWWRFFLWLLKTVAHLAPEWHMARSCQSD